MSEFLKDLKSINKDAELLENSALGEVSEYISTGSLILNSKVSGDMFKGIPSGRISMLLGKSGTGKTYIAGKIAGNAQKQDYEVVWFTSECSNEKSMLSNLGVDTKKASLLPVESLEAFKKQTYNLLQIWKEKYKGKKLMIVLDSLGNLPSQKEITDVLEGHDAQDMGLRAKIIKLIGRLITLELAKLDVPLILINHTYDGKAPNPKMPIPEIPAGGGGGPYISTVAILFTKKIVKDNKADKKEKTGNILKAVTTKNRLVPEGQIAEVKTRFGTGLDMYYGLLDDAEKFGFIKKIGNKWEVEGHEKTFFEKNLYTDAVWKPILEKLNEKIIESNKYHSVSDDILDEQEPELLEEDTTPPIVKKTRKPRVKKDD